MWARRSIRLFAAFRCARRWLPGGFGLVLLALAHAASAFQPQEAAALLQQADRMKTADPAGFAAVLNSLSTRSQELTPAQQELLRYLQAWKSGYDGQYDVASSRLRSIIGATSDFTLKFRANVSLIRG